MKRKAKLVLAVAIMIVLAAAIVLALLTSGPLSPVPWLALAGVVGIPFLLRRETCVDFVAWKDEYNVGIDVIDQEHKKLLSLINNVLAAQQCQTGPDFEHQALDELMEYTEYHFKREEDLMVEHGCVDYESHKGQHDQMRITMKNFRKRYEQEGSEVLPKLSNYLKLWLLQHIAGTDKLYVPVLLEKGVR